RLERGIVDHPDRFAERLRKIVPGPVFPEMFGIVRNFPVAYGRGKPDRDRLITPVFGLILDLLDRFLWAKLGPGGKFAPFLLGRNHHFYIRTADIDDEDIFHA